MERDNRKDGPAMKDSSTALSVSNHLARGKHAPKVMSKNIKIVKPNNIAQALML